MSETTENGAGGGNLKGDKPGSDAGDNEPPLTQQVKTYNLVVILPSFSYLFILGN